MGDDDIVNDTSDTKRHSTGVTVHLQVEEAKSECEGEVRL